MGGGVRLYASVYHDADTAVFVPPVRGGVPAAPRSRDHRAALDADVRPDQPQPRRPRCARLSSTAQLMRFRGRSPRTISYGRTDVVLHPRPGRRGSPPLRCEVALVDGQRYCAAPTLHQPLSHGASRRDSSPFRGAEGWVGAWGVCALVYHDADTFVSLTPVRGGVLDAPWLRDCRGGVGEDGRRGRLHPRLIRCAR